MLFRSNLEELVEEGDLDSPEIEDKLRKHLEPLINEGVDAIALGCTHYPFLSSKIVQIVGPNVAVVDSGGAVARRLKQVLENEEIESLQKGEDRYYTTGSTEKFERVASKLMGNEILAEHIVL